MTINAVEEEISLAVDYVRETLKKKKINSKSIIRASLGVEEIPDVMIAHAESPGCLNLQRRPGFLLRFSVNTGAPFLPPSAGSPFRGARSRTAFSKSGD